MRSSVKPLLFLFLYHFVYRENDPEMAQQQQSLAPFKPIINSLTEKVNEFSTLLLQTC